MDGVIYRSGGGMVSHRSQYVILELSQRDVNDPLGVIDVGVEYSIGRRKRWTLKEDAGEIVSDDVSVDS